MFIPFEIIYEIAGFADWRTVVRLAGTCRELRGRMRTAHWDMPFISNDRDVIRGVLAKFAFDTIDISEARDSADLRQVGSRIVEIFNEAAGRVALSTSSKYIMEGIFKARRCGGRRYNRIEYTIWFGDARCDHSFAPNTPHPDSFMPFDEVHIRSARPAIFKSIYFSYIRYLGYCARECTKLILHGLHVYGIGKIPNLYLIDCKSDGNAVYCDNLHLINSTHIVRDDMINHVIKNVYITKNSKFVSRNKLNDAFPSATFHCSDGYLAVMPANENVPFLDYARLESMAIRYHNINLYRLPGEPSSVGYDLTFYIRHEMWWDGDKYYYNESIPCNAENQTLPQTFAEFMST